MTLTGTIGGSNPIGGTEIILDNYVTLEGFVFSVIIPYNPKLRGRVTLTVQGD